MQARSLRQRRAQSAGFTLVELMTVVLITGILATIAVILVREHFKAAKATRAVLGMQAIAAAEGAYRAQTGEYRDCDAAYYPKAEPGPALVPWREQAPDDVWECWRPLSVSMDLNEYSYKVSAGRPGDAYPTLDTTNDPTLPAALDLWYVIQVQGDQDSDGVLMQGIATSFSSETYLENESE